LTGFETYGVGKQVWLKTPGFNLLCEATTGFPDFAIAMSENLLGLAQKWKQDIICRIIVG
jgi:hypothetical protein